MKVNSLILIYGFVLGVLSFCSIAKSAVPNDPFLGISPQDENYYKISSKTINCKDGSKKFTKAQLNDDFCDCPDGTDEPGTSACPAGKFHCRNAGHIPLLLFSSRVNDGICDCCDGSDEYDGRLKCQNTCWEDGKVARDKLRKKIATYKEGVVLRKPYVEKAKQAIAKDEAELSKLRNEENILKRLVEQLKERKEQIEKEEERERLRKEKEEKETKEAEEKAEREKGDSVEEAKQEKGQAMEKTNVEDKSSESIHDDTIGVLDDSPLDQDMAGEYARHVAGAEQSDNSKNKGSPVNEVEQHVVKEEEESFSPKNVADSDASKIEGSLGNYVEQDVVKEEVSVSPKSKDDSAVASEKGHDAGEVSGDQAVKLGNDVSENSEGLSKEELGRLVASRWTGNSEKQTEGLDVAKDSDHEDHEEKEEMEPDMPDEEHDGYASGSDDDTGKYEDDRGQYYDIDIEDDIEVTHDADSPDAARFSYNSDDEDELDFSDTTFSTSPSWLEKIQHTVRSILQAVNIFQTPLDKSGAAHVRKEYEVSSAKLTKIQSRISSLTQKLKHDFGIEKEFYSFYDQCFESIQNKYVYKVCPFKHASQQSYSLGRWDKFEDSYRVMIFSIGDRCYTGPYRSLKVKLRCGLKNELTNVVEPSICEYEAVLSTPVLCLEEKLKELENKLDLMNKEQSKSHDEL